jgi:hypothetical protein
MDQSLKEIGLLPRDRLLQMCHIGRDIGLGFYVARRPHSPDGRGSVAATWVLSLDQSWSGATLAFHEDLSLARKRFRIWRSNAVTAEAICKTRRARGSMLSYWRCRSRGMHPSRRFLRSSEIS